MMESERSSRLPLAAFLFSTLLVGLNPVGVRFTVLELAPFWGAAIRFAPAALLLGLLSLVLRLPFPRGKALLGTLLFGLLNFGASYGFLYWGFQAVKPGMGSIFLALVPLLTLLFAVAHRQETFRWRALAGAILAFAGVAFVFGEQVNAQVPLVSLLAVLMGAVCIAESSVIIKQFPRNHPVTTNAVAMGVGAALLMVLALITREPLVLPQRSATWTALVYLILFGSCTAFILILYVLKHWTASTTAYQFVFLPFISIAASAWLTGETLSPLLLVGAALVLSGVFLGAFTKKKSRPQMQPAEIVAVGFSEIPITGQTPIERTEQSLRRR